MAYYPERYTPKPKKKRPADAGSKPARNTRPVQYTPSGTIGRSGLPDFEFETPRVMRSGISQEPNSPWGVAIHDPLERQRVEVTPAGIPVLKNTPVYTPRGGAGGYYPQGYSSSGWGGGGGGGGGGGSYLPQASPYWWNPGLVNWRYGVRY